MPKALPHWVTKITAPLIVKQDADVALSQGLGPPGDLARKADRSDLFLKSAGEQLLEAYEARPQ